MMLEPMLLQLSIKTIYKGGTLMADRMKFAWISFYGDLRKYPIKTEIVMNYAIKL